METPDYVGQIIFHWLRWTPPTFSLPQSLGEAYLQRIIEVPENSEFY